MSYAVSAPMLTIWGRISALNVLKVVWAADETGVPYQRLDAGRVFGVVDSPRYRALNPNGLVPTLVDGDFVLWESNAIIRYLCARYANGRLYPAELRQRMRAESWMDWQATQLFGAYRAAFNYYVRGLTSVVNETEAESSFQSTNSLFAILDDQLSRTPFVAGENFTMGDIPVGIIAHQWLALPRSLPPLLNVRRWYEQLAGRSGAKQTFAVPVGLMPDGTVPNFGAGA